MVSQFVERLTTLEKKIYLEKYILEKELVQLRYFIGNEVYWELDLIFLILDLIGFKLEVLIVQPLVLTFAIRITLLLHF